MRKKTLALFSLMLAFVMALSLAVLAGCKKGNKTEKPKGDGTAVSLVSDETLKDKLLALYTFEDTDKTLKASDPFTGEAREANNGTYGDNYKLAVNPKANGGSTTVFDTSTAFSLGRFDETQIADEFEDYFIVEGNTYEGLSFSFWAYNTVTLEGEVDSLGESADWANLVTNGYESINWGNLSYMATSTGSYMPFHPTNGTVIGRGAYTEDSYAQARELYTDSELAKFRGKSDYFAVWNAISGNTQGEGSDDNEYVAPVAAAYLQTWRYVTINIDLEEGLSFYNNGRLAYTYQPKTFITLAGGWEQIYADLVMGAMKEYEADEMYLNFFNAESGIYVDDLIVGKSLAAADACNLYEDVSGKTWTDADLELTSALSQGDQEEQEEKNQAVDQYINDMIASFPVEGDVWGSAADPIKDAGVAGKDTNQDGKINDVIGAARDAFEYVAGDYIETVGNVNLTSGVTLAASDNYSPKLNNDGTFEMTVSGIQLSKGQGNYQGTYVSLYDGTSFVGAVRVDWAASNNIKGWTWDVSKVIMPADTNGQITGEVTWVNTSTDGIYLNVAQRFCNLDIVFKYTGAKLTITYNMYYYFAGETVELITESGTEFSAQIPKDESTLFATITYEIKPASGKTLETALDMKNLSLRFGMENSAFLIKEAEGANTTKAAAYSYGGSYQPDENYAKVKLPSAAEDFNVTYTADLYTAETSAWVSPAFYLIESNDTNITAATLNGAQMLGVRGDNWAGVCQNLSEANKGTTDKALPNCAFPKTINYIKNSAGGVFRYQLGDVLYTNGVKDLCEVIAVKLIVNIVYVADTHTYTVTYYRNTAEEDNIIYQFSVVFETGNDVVLCIGGEGTYMENIVITNNIVGGSDLTLTKTTSGTKTAVNTDGYTPVTAA